MQISLSQRAATSPLCWVSYSLSVPSAPVTPRHQITALAQTAPSNQVPSKFNRPSSFQANKGMDGRGVVKITWWCLKIKKIKFCSAQNGVKPGKFLFPVAAMNRLFKFVCSAAAITHTQPVCQRVSLRNVSITHTNTPLSSFSARTTCGRRSRRKKKGERERD